MTWQPSASIEVLKSRAAFYGYIRNFFALRDVMEVETPLISGAGVNDANLEPVVAQCCGKPVYLHTSPEYPMKRLLAAGSGDIYQICKTFRDGEQGRRHNPEFTMLEYYRLGFGLTQLMDELAQFAGDFLHIQSRLDLTYQDAVHRFTGLNPFTVDQAVLRSRVAQFVGDDLELDRDGCLDILMSHVVEPQLPSDTLVFIYDYPASQAALAKTYRGQDEFERARRFELYVNGLELANGYHELTDPVEQQRRFAEQANMRARQQQDDQYFLEALEQGLPDCSGVAIGLDRLLMIKHQAAHISEVLSFDFSRA